MVLVVLVPLVGGNLEKLYDTIKYKNPSIRGHFLPKINTMYLLNSVLSIYLACDIY